MEFKGRNLLFSIAVALMAIPPVVMIVPLFVLYSRIGMISTYEGAILIYAGLITPFSVYLLTTFFRTLPKELVRGGADGWGRGFPDPVADRPAAFPAGAPHAAGRQRASMSGTTC